MKWQSSFLRFLSSSEAKTAPLQPAQSSGQTIPEQNCPLKSEEQLLVLPVLPNNSDGEKKMAITVAKLNMIADAVQTVESIAATAVQINGVAPTAAQKLAAAVSIATTVDPTLAAEANTVQVIIGSLVNIFNLFGIFRKKVAPVTQAAPMPAPVAGP